MPSTDTLRFEDVTVCYRRRPAVHHVTSEVRAGTLTALLGPNGAGKSTLMRAAVGALPLTTGGIFVGSVPAPRACARLAYLPQRSEIDWNFPATVREVVAQGRFPNLGSFRRAGGDDERAIEGAIIEMSLQKLAGRPIHALSGGQQQRVFLARALAQGADIFLLDEPFNGLDVQTRADLVRRLKNWQQQGRTVLAAMHNLELARSCFTHAIFLQTHLVAAGPIEEVIASPEVKQIWLRGAELLDSQHAHS